MKTPDDQLLARWLDGELNEQETARFEALMAADPALRDEAESLRKISAALRQHVHLEREVPHGDFFNAQIQERIAEMQRADERAQAAEASPLQSWLGWLRLPWTLGAAAAVVALALLVFKQERPATQILSFYAPNPQIKASAYHNADADATVLMLDGLDSIPAERDVAGMHVDHSRNDLTHASTTLFDAEGGILLVMGRNAANLPTVFGR